MTNLIAKVAELRELAAKDIPGKYTSDCPEYDYMVGVLNAAPGLLAALGKVHAKDSEILDLFVAFMSRFKPDGHLNDIGPGAKITNAKAAACLRRYADLARLMEDEYAT